MVETSSCAAANTDVVAPAAAALADLIADPIPVKSDDAAPTISGDIRNERRHLRLLLLEGLPEKSWATENLRFQIRMGGDFAQADFAKSIVVRARKDVPQNGAGAVFAPLDQPGAALHPAPIASANDSSRQALNQSRRHNSSRLAPCDLWLLPRNSLPARGLTSTALYPRTSARPRRSAITRQARPWRLCLSRIGEK